jgi:hypothetical protein
METYIVTKDRLEYLLQKDHVTRMHTIGRALVVLYNNQTASEQSYNATRLTNGEGFTQADARSGSIGARFYLAKGCLNDWTVEKWMKTDARGNRRISKYWRQLDEAAKAKKAT